MPAIILFAVWKNFGYNMIIFLAGLQAIPSELYEAARIDGAGPLQQLRHVTLPLLAPTLVLVGILTIIGYFQLFAEPYVMTQGGPLRSTRQRRSTSCTRRAFAGGTSATRRRSRSCCSSSSSRVSAGAAALRPRRGGAADEPAASRSGSSTACSPALAAATLFPLLWMLSVSFMPAGERDHATRRRSCRAGHARALPHAVRTRRHGPLPAQQPADRVLATADLA